MAKNIIYSKIVSATVTDEESYVISLYGLLGSFLEFAAALLSAVDFGKSAILTGCEFVAYGLISLSQYSKLACKAGKQAGSNTSVAVEKGVFEKTWPSDGS